MTLMGKAKQTGIALVLVLWLVMLLAIMAAGYSYAMRSETMLTIHGVERAKARGYAEAGLWLAAADLLKPQSKRQWRTDSSPREINFGEGTISVSIQDEAGKIDLNAADETLLRGLLETAVEPGADVIFLLHVILDWRDPDKLRRNPGAEDSDYLNTGYGAKDGPFNSVEELQMVDGMTHHVYEKLYPALTIHHPQQPGINPGVAPGAVLSAVPDSDAELIDTFLSTRNNQDNIAAAHPISSDYFIGGEGVTFTVTSEGMAGLSKVKLEMVISLDKGAIPPYSVLSWRESKTFHVIAQHDGLNQDARSAER